MEDRYSQNRDKKNQNGFDVGSNTRPPNVGKAEIPEQKRPEQAVAENRVARHDQDIYIQIRRFFDKDKDRNDRKYLYDDASCDRQPKSFRPPKIPVDIENRAQQPDPLEQRDGVSFRRDKGKGNKIENDRQTGSKNLNNVYIPKECFTFFGIVLLGGDAAGTIVLDSQHGKENEIIDPCQGCGIYSESGCAQSAGKDRRGDQRRQDRQDPVRHLVGDVFPQSAARLSQPFHTKRI